MEIGVRNMRNRNGERMLLLAAGLYICANKKVIRKKTDQTVNLQAVNNIYDRWFTLRERGIYVSNYIQKHKFSKVAIYGMGKAGNHLYEELQSHKRNEIIMGIDRSLTYHNYDMPVLSLDDDISDIDIAIVTPVNGTKEIIETLKSKGVKQVMTLSEVLGECEKFLYQYFEKID